jgi:hypothetical protein
LAVAANLHHDARGHYPPGMSQATFTSTPQYRGSSLFVHMLPYLEQVDLKDKWNFTDPMVNTQGGAAALTARVLPTLLCPSDEWSKNPAANGVELYGLTSYAGNGGTKTYPPQSASVDGMFHTTGSASDPVVNQKPVSEVEVIDGPGSTLFFAERNAADANYEEFAAIGWGDSLARWGSWAPSGGRKNIVRVTFASAAPLNYKVPFTFATKGSASPPASTKPAFDYYVGLRLSAMGSHHAGLVNAVCVDTSGRALADDVSVTALQALCTRAGREK